MTQEIKLPKLVCKRCSHIWIPRKDEPPEVCPSCKSPWWNKDKIIKEAPVGAKD